VNFVDNNNDGIDDVTGALIPPRQDPATVFPTPTIVQEDEGKVYYQIERNRPFEAPRIVQVSEQDAMGRFFNRPPADIKKIQAQFIRAGYKDIKATGKLDSPEQVSAYTKAVKDALNSYSNLVQLNPNTNISNIGTFIDNAAAQGSGKGPSTSVYETLYLTSEADAISYFNQLYLEYTGTTPTPKQAKQFYKTLSQQEKQNVQRQTTTTGEGYSRTVVTKGGVDEVDKEQIALGFIEKAIPLEGVEKVSGVLGKNLRDINTVLADYNVNVDPVTKREYLLASVKSKNGLNDVVGKIQNLSALQNPALAPYIQQGYKPSEVLGGFKQFKTSLTGLPSSPGLWDDPDIKWLSTQQQLPDYESFRTKVLDRPEADYYPEQRRQAANYALKILDTWGLR
jgi:hypothetical protein